MYITRDQPAIPTLLPPVTLGFRQFWLEQAGVGIAGVAHGTETDWYLLTGDRHVACSSDSVVAARGVRCSTCTDDL